MSTKKVSEFFKNIFRRESAEVPTEQIICHSCETALAPDPMGPRLIERCPKCRGTWISQTQLKEILAQAAQKAAEGVEAVESDGHADIGNTFAPSRVKRGCPACKLEMDNFKFEETGIWIDSCPDGHGIWLDEGELRLLAQRGQKDKNAEPVNQGTVLDAVSELILGSL